MAKFLLLLRDDPTGFAGLSPAEMQKVIGEYRAWAQGLRDAGKIHDSDKLTDDAGKVLANRRGTVTVKDGPYAETKESIGGYFIVEAADYAAAVEIARGCPQLRTDTGSVEVRQIHEM